MNPTHKVLQPTPWQERVLHVPEAYNLALLGGRGGGKTTAATLLGLRHAVQYESRARVLIIRATYKSLAQLYDELVALFEVAFPLGLSCNRGEMTIRCPNGAVITLGNLQDRRDVVKHQGQECTLLIVDEVTNFSTMRYINMLQANLRGPADVPTRMVVLGNPGGPLHAQISRLHVHGRLPWRPYTLEDGSQWVFAPSTFVDNPTLDQDRYSRSIVASAGGDRALAAAWLEGNWNDLAGAFFADVWGDHLLIPDAHGNWAVPTGPVRNHGWVGRVALDWGWSAPAVAVLAIQPQIPGLRGPGRRIFPQGSWIVVDEVHSARSDDFSLGKGWPPQILAEEILAGCRRWNIPAQGVADDARGLSGQNDTLIQQLREYRLYMTRPKKDRISGWVRLKSMMAAAQEADGDSPSLYISERCRLTLETMPLLPRDDVRIEDVDTSANDHAADALRYLVNSPLGGARSSRRVGV